jgi:hypothetical protein
VLLTYGLWRLFGIEITAIAIGAIVAALGVHGRYFDNNNDRRS